MGTLTGNGPAWGEEWDYGRDNPRYHGGAAEVIPDRDEDATSRGEASGPANDISALLFCVVFWLLFGAAVILW